jgi:glutamine amidotransferase
MIVIVDYGLGNLRSVQKGFARVGYEAEISDDPRKLETADGVVLPGVGAFGDCYAGLADRGLVEPVKAAALSGRPFLGICVGLQLLFDGSEESPDSPGLGLIPGRVVRFADARETGLKVPHMGWNKLIPAPGRDNPLLKEVGPEPYTYFVHSYYAQPEDDTVILARCEYGKSFAAMVGRGNLFAVQFHPEKSQADGLLILKAFGELASNGAKV